MTKAALTALPTVNVELPPILPRTQAVMRPHSLLPVSPPQVYAYLSRVMYNRRNKMNPLWNSLVIGGVEPDTGKPFLGMVSMQGTHYVDSHVTTGVRGCASM